MLYCSSKMKQQSYMYLRVVTLQVFIVFALVDSASILTLLPLGYPGSNVAESSFRLELNAVVESVNKGLEHKLSIEVIRAHECNAISSQSKSHDLLINFVNSMLHQGKNISGVVELCHGISVPFDMSHVSTFFKTALSGLTTTKTSRKLILSQVVSAWYSFMNHVGWTQFGIITDIKDVYSFHLAQLLIERAQKHGVKVTMNIQHCCTTEIHSPLPNIVFVSVSTQNAMQLLCTLYKRQQLWPKHVWVLHSNWHDAFLSDSAVLPECDVNLAQQGVIFLRNQRRPDDVHSLLESGISYWNYTTILMDYQTRDNISLQPNGYTNRLHDLLLAVVLKPNGNYTQKSDNFTFRGAQGIVKVNSNGWMQSNIDFVQVRGAHVSSIAIYNIAGEVHLTDPLFRELASLYKPRLRVIGGSTFYIVGLATEIALGLLLTTVMLVLLLIFRKEPEVKSTSFTLSLLMFLGCYLTLLYLSLLLHFDQSYNSLHASHLHNLCRSQPWLSGLGIPLTLTVAVLLIKMLRVYHIFHRLIPGAVGKPCSDLFLMVYVIILLIPNILIHIVWSAFDEYSLSVEYMAHSVDIIEVKKQCVCQYFYHWLTILSANLALLLLALLVVAVKSRKIQLTHFKDTKKANALVFATNVNLFLTLSYWLFLRGIDAENHITHLPLHFGHSAFVVLCQVLLFAPKVLPPSQRYISRTLNKHKSRPILASSTTRSTF